jgi:hypothetical protein
VRRRETDNSRTTVDMILPERAGTGTMTESWNCDRILLLSVLPMSQDQR